MGGNTSVDVYHRGPDCAGRNPVAAQGAGGTDYLFPVGLNDNRSITTAPILIFF
jgi:hypothetical protein